MYRKSVESTKDTFPSFLGLNGINMKCFQEMYLDTSMYHSPSISPTSTDCASSPLLHTTMTATASAGASLSAQQHNNHRHNHLQQIQQQQQIKWRNTNILGSGGIGVSDMPKMGCSTSLNILQLQQQQKQQLLHNLKQQQQEQMVSYTAPDYANNQHDEISKSLKMFAMQTAYKLGNEQIFATQPPPVDAIMYDFACNGHICDEFNRFQHRAVLQSQYFQVNGRANIINDQVQLQHHQQQKQQQQPQQFHQNIWMTLPSHMQHQPAKGIPTDANAAVAAATITCAANMDYNSYKKSQKRYAGNKNDKYASSKHCVFCENNNEPEAVVKSHAVRDTFGRVLCPKLRIYICPICKASGDMAHTVKYCPQKPIITMEDAIKAEAFRLAKGTYQNNKNNNTNYNYNQQMKV